jgi:hypothetical protein
MLVQHMDGLDAMHDLMRLHPPPKQRQVVRVIGGEQRLLRL